MLATLGLEKNKIKQAVELYKMFHSSNFIVNLFSQVKAGRQCWTAPAVCHSQSLTDASANAKATDCSAA